MSTTLEQSQWLDQVAQGIEQPCQRCWSDGGRISESVGSTTASECLSCHGSGKVRPYAETGVAGWLRAKKGSGWPSLVWFFCSYCEDWSLGLAMLLLESPPFLIKCRISYHETTVYKEEHYHALDSEDAFALLEEVGWRWWRQFDDDSPEDRLVFGAMRRGKQVLNEILWADSLSKLLDKIMAEEEKA